MLARVVSCVVDLSCRLALVVVLASLAAAGGLGWYAAHHFKINTDVNQLLSQDLDWRKQEKAMELAFPQNVDNLVIVIDGDTPAAAEGAATQMAERLSALTAQFSEVRRPDAIPFFRKNGLLYLSKDELSATLDQLVQAQPLLGMLSTDPSIRGLCSMLDLMVQGFQAGQVDYTRLDVPLAKIADTVDAAMAGQNKPLPLQDMTGDARPANPRDLRKFILTKPTLDYTQLESGKAARDTVRALTEELQLTPDHGVHVRMTGPVALSDEELASVAGGTAMATIVSAVSVFVLLWLGLRSMRIVLPILVTLAVGLVATLAFAVAFVGSLNMISVAFAVMFIGIAVDFGIQFGVRYRDQHHREPDNARAMTRTAQVIATPLTMAAASTALGFMAFIPTAYRGVSELGMIAGAGMVIAFLLNITLLPALITLTKPPAERDAIGFAWAAPLDRMVSERRRPLLAGAVLLGLVGAILAWRLPFDFDPLNLKDPSSESVSTMFDVMRDPDSGSYALNVLRPNLSDAMALADQAAKLPEVDHAMTLASFVPDDQPAKLATLADANMLLGPTLNLPQQPPPTDDENSAAMKKLAADLHTIGKDHASAEHLATALDGAAQRNDTAILARMKGNLIDVMQASMAMTRDMLTATAVTADDITDDLRRDWVTADGRYLVQIHPKGDARQHDTLVAFTKAVRALAPDATGTPISIQESGTTVTSAFILAGILAIAAIAILSFFILRSAKDVIILLTPLILAGILTLATMVVIGLPMNFANIIAMPLLLSLGVSYAIYFVSYRRGGQTNPLQSSMARAVLFSAATVLVAFGSLALSSHPGTAGMGKLLTVALVYSLLFTFFVLPALLDNHKPDRH